MLSKTSQLQLSRSRPIQTGFIKHLRQRCPANFTVIHERFILCICGEQIEYIYMCVDNGWEGEGQSNVVCINRFILNICIVD